MRTDKSSTLSRLSTGLIVLAGLLLVCVLSIGPAARLGSLGYVSETAFAKAYDPVLLICEHSDTADQVLAWYIRLWLGTTPGPFSP